MSSKDPSSTAPPTQGGQDSSSPPTIFAPGEDRLSENALRVLSPREMIWRHRSVETLSDSLIMMVDDESLNIEMTQAFLQEAGYTRFLQTQDPEQALPMLRKEPPAVLLLDLTMPKVSGLEILAAMREDSQLRHVPVL